MIITCHRCGAECFGKKKSRRFCDDCRVLIDKEQRAAACKRWRERNPNANREAAKSWRESNPEKSRTCARLSYYNNHASRKQSRDERRPLLRARGRAYRIAHLNMDAAKSRRRHARLRGAVGSHTLAEFREVCCECSWRCVYCGTGLDRLSVTVDHVVPVSRGGTDNIDNIAPACRSCNSAKKDKSVHDFLSALGKAVA